MKYELTLLLPEEVEIKSIKDTVNSLQGKVEKEERWGKKTLIYPIKKKSSAYFFHWLLEMNQNNINELKKKLNFNEKLLRYLLLRFE